MLTKRVRVYILDKAEFKPDYCLIQTLLDRPEIMQIHQFMEYPKFNCLDLQFILPKKATAAKDIKKTIIFVNNVSDICPLINIIVDWIKKLGYPDSCSNWIKPYHSIISDWDKDLITNTFLKLGNENMEYTILVATDAYGIGIDNPDIKFVIQQDFSINFDTIIK